MSGFINVVEKQTLNVPGLTSLFVSFPYNESIKKAIQQRQIRYWHPETYEWEMPITDLSWLIKEFGSQLDINLTFINKEDEKQQVELPDKMPELVDTNLFQHQIDGVKYGYNNDSFILGDEQGLGKTLMTIDLALLRKQQFGLEHCLIVCCINDLKYVWKKEIEKRTNEKAKLLGLRKRKVKDTEYIGSIKDRVDDLMQPIDEFFIITNIESFNDSTSKEKKELRKKQKGGKKEYESVIVDAILNGPNKIDMIVIDEAHKIKSYNKGRGNNVDKLRAARFIEPISGTILLNSPEDAYMPLHLIGAEKSSYTMFRNYYCEFGGYGDYQVVGYKNLDVLREMLSKCMLRRLKSEVLDLPPKMYQTIEIEMSDKQRIYYDRVRNSILEASKEHLSMEKFNNYIMRLRQMTVCPDKIFPECTDNAKLDMLEEFVENIVSDGGKVVVVSNWTSVTSRVMERLKKYKPALYTGEIPSTERPDVIDRFQNDPNCKVFVGTMATMGAGLTLTAGQTMIFMDDAWNKGTKEQCVDRIHRIGTNGTVNIYTFVCKNTIDERIEDVIYNKSKITDYLIDGEVEETNLNTVLNFLLSA